MTKEEIIEMAIQANFDEHHAKFDTRIEAFARLIAEKAIKEALTQTQKPVAWGVFDDNLHDMFFAKEEAQEMVRLKGDGSTVKPLYTTPPQREFVGLTDEEILEIASPMFEDTRYPSTALDFARAILKKVQEDKNTRGQK